MDSIQEAKDITVEALRKLLGVIVGLQGVIKQHNGIILDIYERIAALEKLHEKIEGEDMGAHTP